MGKLLFREPGQNPKLRAEKVGQTPQLLPAAHSATAQPIKSFVEEYAPPPARSDQSRKPQLRRRLLGSRSIFAFCSFTSSLLDMRTRNSTWRIAHCACALPGVAEVAKVAHREGSAAETGRRGPKREGSRDEGRVDVER